MKAKIFLIHSRYIDDEYEHFLSNGVSDWEEMSPEEFKFVKDNLWRLEAKNRNDSQYVLVSQDEKSISDRIVDIKNAISEEIKKEQKRKEELEKKRLEAAEKRALNKMEKNKKLLKKLIESNPDLIKEVVNS